MRISAKADDRHACADNARRLPGLWRQGETCLHELLDRVTIAHRLGDGHLKYELSDRIL